MCGELIEVVQHRPVLGSPFISKLLWGTLRISMIIQEMKIVEKKSKSTKLSVQQTTDGEQPTKSAANQHRVHGVIFNALLMK